VFFDPDNLEKSKFDFVVKVDSINTNNGKRDTHLRSDDFFAVSKYPVMTFKSSRVSHIIGNKYALEGQMTIKDVTKSMALEFIYWGQKGNPFKKNEMVAGFDTRFNIDRLDFHVGDGKFYKMGVVGKDVDVLITLEAVRMK
jgi:polyisoprenoid-binding protein YceI